LNKFIVLYKSKYGAAKRYALWLAEALGCPAIETKQAKISDVEQFDTIILGGGIYAGGIAGISFLKKNYERLKNKSLLVYAVGASPFSEDGVAQLRNRHFRGDLQKIPLFYLRGAWNETKMSWSDRTLCAILKKSIAKKTPQDYAPWEKALMDAIGTDCDWTDKESLAPIIGAVSHKYT
jgi:menaquinone-dependent protoporphyrinogen IX oxidase